MTEAHCTHVYWDDMMLLSMEWCCKCDEEWPVDEEEPDPFCLGNLLDL